MQKCKKCGKEIVHPNRIYPVCLDCVAEQINDLGMRVANIEEKLKNFDQQVIDVAINNLGNRMDEVEKQINFYKLGL